MARNETYLSPAVSRHVVGDYVRRTGSGVEGRLETLTPRQREVLVLREIEDLSYKHIAAVLDLPIGTVMSRIARAREKLAVELRGRLERRDHGLPDV